MIYYLVTLSKKSQKTNQKKKIDMQVGGMESEESEGDGVLRLVNPNTKTADLNSIKKICKAKTNTKKMPYDVENMKEVHNNFSNQLNVNLQKQILKVS